MANLYLIEIFLNSYYATNLPEEASTTGFMFKISDAKIKLSLTQ